MHFCFAGGDAEMSSLRLRLGGDVGETGISFLLLWGGVGGIGERSVKASCASCSGGVDGIGERSVEENCGSCPGGVLSSSTHWSRSRPHDK